MAGQGSHSIQKELPTILPLLPIVLSSAQAASSMTWMIIGFMSKLSQACSTWPENRYRRRRLAIATANPTNAKELGSGTVAAADPAKEEN